MRTDDHRAELRGALYRADGRAVVADLSAEEWHDALQLGGDGLLVALGQGVDGAPLLANRCAAALRERAWEGDDDLAEQLEAALGQHPAPQLRPLPVDLEELADVLEGDPAHGGGRADRPPPDRPLRARHLPPLQGCPRPLARGAPALVRVLGRAPARPGPPMAP